MRHVAILALLFGACSNMAPHRKLITFTSTPPGQTVNVDGQPYKMPCRVSLATDVAHTASFPNGETIKIKRTVTPWVFLNAVTLGATLPYEVMLDSDSVRNNLTPKKIQYHDGAVWSGKKRLEPLKAPFVGPYPNKRREAERARQAEIEASRHTQRGTPEQRLARKWKAALNKHDR